MCSGNCLLWSIILVKSFVTAWLFDLLLRIFIGKSDRLTTFRDLIVRYDPSSICSICSFSTVSLGSSVQPLISTDKYSQMTNQQDISKPENSQINFVHQGMELGCKAGFRLSTLYAISAILFVGIFGGGSEL